MSKLTPFDIAKTINTKSEYLNMDDEGGNNRFLLNRLFSNTQDSVFFANEANMFTQNISEKMIYDFYFHGLPKSSRYGKWYKPEKDENPEMIKYIQDYFNYSKKKAIEAIQSFSPETLIEIQKDIDLLNRPVSTKRARKKKEK